jgi:hypothetical protein
MTNNDRHPAVDEIEAMFVQTAASAEGHPGRLILRGMSPSTLYFSDRPQRVVGHITNQQFIDLWAEGDNSFYDDPPNAVLAFVEDGDERPDDVVVMLLEPTLIGDEMTYTVHVLESSLPTTAGPCTLFIDPLGRPLSPMSIAGMHRSMRRRERRRELYGKGGRTPFGDVRGAIPTPRNPHPRGLPAERGGWSPAISWGPQAGAALRV